MDMFGRNRELTSLMALLDTAIGGKQAWALVSGEAWIGKSRLVAEL